MKSSGVPTTKLSTDNSTRLDKIGCSIRSRIALKYMKHKITSLENHQNDTMIFLFRILGWLKQIYVQCPVCSVQTRLTRLNKTRQRKFIPGFHKYFLSLAQIYSLFVQIFHFGQSIESRDQLLANWPKYSKWAWKIMIKIAFLTKLFHSQCLRTLMNYLKVLQTCVSWSVP